MENKYFDIQVNGYAGIDFNQNNLSLENFRQACLKLEEDGVEGIFATIITADLSDMISRIKLLVSLRMKDPLCSERSFTFGSCERPGYYLL